VTKEGEQRREHDAVGLRVRQVAAVEAACA
jgi:hypothetical protein